jgi:transcription elongation factor GreA
VSIYTYLSKAGYDKLKAELEVLRSDGRAEVARAIAEARDKGDLSENAEYDAAKDAQGMLELKISEIEKALANARIVDESTLDISKVTVLSNVRIKNHKLNKEVTYKIVSESEADLKTGRISVSSPIGSGLLGKAVGEFAEIETPAGVLKLEVLEISID